MESSERQVTFGAIRAVGARALLGVIVACAASCGPKSGEPARQPNLGKTAKSKDEARAAAGAGLSAERVVSVPAGTFGPYLARRGDSRILVWASIAGGKRTWRSVVLDALGKPSAPVELGAAPERVGLVSLEATSSGYVLLASSDTQPMRLEATVLDAQGKKVSGPETMAEEPGDLLWVDWVSTAKDPIALWALRKESVKSDRADVFARGLASGSAVRVVEQVRAWQTASFGEGAALAVVRATTTELGPVDLFQLGADGKVQKTLHITSSATAEPDVDMVRLGGGLVLAWTDRAGLETRVVSAAVDAAGKLTAAPKALAAPRGDQALVRLVPPQATDARSAFAVWEDAIDQLPDTRRLRVASLHADARAGTARALLDFASVEGGVPELAASAEGLSALTLAKPCERDAPCSAPAVATLVELDQKLNPVLATPLNLAPLGGKPAPLAWGLSCGPSRCLVLAATDGAPAEVYAVRPDGAQNLWKPAAEREPVSVPPSLSALSSVARVDAPLSSVAATQQGDKSLVAWLTFFDPSAPWTRLKKPAKDGRFDPPRALLETAQLGSSATHTISFRARSTSGVALASDGGAHGESMLVWSALDNQVPQLFTTVLDASGKKLRQRMLTRSKGEKSDVALAQVPDGWVIAWVDERSGAPEVYSAKVNRFLQRVGPEHRVGGAGVTPSALAVVRAGNDALVAWVAKASSGPSEVQLQRVSGQDASAKGDPKSIKGSGVVTCSLTPTETGALLGFVESSGSDSTMLRLLPLDAEGNIAGSAQSASLKADAVGLDLACASGVCRVAVISAEGARGAVYVSSWSVGKGALPALKRIAAQTGAAVSSAKPVLVSGGLVLADQRAGRGVVRYAEVTWK